MVRGPQVLFVELKSEKGRLTLAQRSWGDALNAANVDGGLQYHVWRPSLWISGFIAKELE
jgi:hypothetical protein